MFSQEGGLQVRRPHSLQAVGIGLGRLLNRVLDTKLEKEQQGTVLWSGPVVLPREIWHLAARHTRHSHSSRRNGHS